MAFKLANRVKMSVSGTPGTGTITLGSALTGYQSFAAGGISNGDTVSYVLEDAAIPAWEIGVGTYTSSGTTLARTSITASSNAGSAISATSAAVVFIAPLAADLQSTDTLTSGTLGVARGGTGLTSLTAGYIPFGGSSTYSSDSNLFWDNTNKRLGVGTATPTAVLSVFSASASPTSVANGVRFLESTNGYGLNLGGSSTGYAWIQGVYGGSSTLGYNNISIQPNGGSVGIGNTSPAYKLDVTGAIRSSNAGNGNVWLSDGTYQSSLQQNSTDLYLNANAGGAANGGFIWRSSNSYTTRMTLDASGNLGLGVTPSAWDSLYRVFQIGGNPALASDQAGQWVANAYYNAGWKYISNNYAARYEINKSNGGIHAWYNAPSGTAGTAITFTQAMTLDASGRLGVGPTSLTYPLETSATGGYWNNSNNWSTTPAAIVVTNKTAGGYDPVFIGQMTDSGGTAKNAFAIGAVGTSSWTAGNNGTQTADLYIAVRNNSGGISERMRIDTNGNVGIGTTSPQARFHSKAGATSQAGIFEAANSVALLSFVGSSTSSYTRVQIGADVNDMVLYTTGTERARIDSSGNIGFWTTPTTWSAGKGLNLGASGALWAYADGDTQIMSGTYFNGAYKYLNTGTKPSYIRFDSGGIINTFTCTSTGTAGNTATFTTGPYVANGGTSWTTGSDERIKVIIEPIENSVDKILNLRAVIGRLKTDDTSVRRVFLIAQDVQTVLPEAVDASNPEKLGLNYQDIIPLLVASVKELAAKVQALEAKVA